MTAEIIAKQFPDIQQILDTAKRLHSDIPYRGDLTMFDQVAYTASLAAQAGDEALTALMLLHKSQESKKISGGQSPLSDDDIRSIAGRYGQDVIDALAALKSEPDDKKMKASGLTE